MFFFLARMLVLNFLILLTYNLLFAKFHLFVMLKFSLYFWTAV